MVASAPCHDGPVSDTAAMAVTDLIPLPPQPAGVPWPTLLWPCGEPDDDVDEEALQRQFATLFSAKQEKRLGQTHALLVVHRGRIVAEQYARGVAANSKRISWSTAKSMVNAAIGILVRDGRVDLDAPAAVPEWSDPTDPRHGITLRQLLQFRSGLDWNEDYVDDSVSDVIEMLFGGGQPDMAAHAANKPLVAEPGETFGYSSGTSNIISRILCDIVGPNEECTDFLRTELFGPLGMTTAEPRYDEAGTWIGSSYCYCTARDFARFAYLYLRDGVWDGMRILPEGWVDFSRTPTSVDEEGDEHGAHFWMWDENPYGAFLSAGYEGQYLLIAPALDLVVVRLGKTVAELRPALRREVSAILTAFGGAGSVHAD